MKKYRVCGIFMKDQEDTIKTLIALIFVNFIIYFNLLFIYNLIQYIFKQITHQFIKLNFFFQTLLSMKRVMSVFGLSFIIR